MKKFSVKRKLHISPLMLTVCVFAIFIGIFIYSISTVDTSNNERQEEILMSALERDIMHCYALEGYYPPSLAYIEEHYGLIYDKDEYIVDYRPIGNNIYPNLAIIKKGGKNEKKK